ncbi:MAG: hypothetical protein ACRDNS_33545 [Trebonia sp.]
MSYPWQPEQQQPYVSRHGRQALPPPPQGYLPPPRPPRRRPPVWVITLCVISGAVFLAGAVSAIINPAPAAKTSVAAATPAAAPHSPSRASSAAPSPSRSAFPSCKLHTTFSYIERDIVPGLRPSAVEIGNVDLGNCTPALADFASEAANGPGDCSTIALASDNPGYNADVVPAPPLRKVIESAGPGCS